MDRFNKIAEFHGSSSVEKKKSIIQELLLNAEPQECKFIIRWLEGNLKIGAAEKTILSAFARAIAITPPNQQYPPTKIDLRRRMGKSHFDEKVANIEKDIKGALNQYPNYNGFLDAILKIGDQTDRLHEFCKMTPGIPVKPMLAQPTTGINIILKRFENIPFTCEFKYDGFRGQIHFVRDPKTNEPSVYIFSRNLEDMSEAYPDIRLLMINEYKDSEIENFIIDSEIVPYDQREDKILPFQLLTTRTRKNTTISSIQVQVCLFVFDILYLNGNSCFNQTLQDRRDTLKEHFHEIPTKFQFARFSNLHDLEEIQEFLQLSIKESCEGLIIKTFKENATYLPAKRSFNWLKLKKDYLDTQLGDSIDLVPVGADYGIGKRTGMYGTFLLAAYDEDTETFRTVTKAGTGFSDENLSEIYKNLSEIALTQPHKDLRIKEKNVQVWFQPKYVWEMKAADLTISPIYTAGIGEIKEDKGIGLRFPRFIRWRNDKKPEEATTCEMIVDMYKKQASIGDNFQDIDY